MKIKSLLLGALCAPLLLPKAYGWLDKPNYELVDVNKIHSAFPLAAQGHEQNSQLIMNGESVIVGTRVYNAPYAEHNKRAPGQGHVYFAKQDINGQDGGFCYADAKAAKQTCAVTGELGPNYHLGRFNPPEMPFESFSSAKESPAVHKSPQEKFNGGKFEFEGGEYWLETLDVNNGAQLSVQPGTGDVTLYIKDKVTINGASVVGSAEQKINIVSYGSHALDLNNGSTLYGGLMTKGNIEINGDSTVRLFGSVRAKKVDFDVATLELGAGNHWFDSMEINNEANLTLSDTGFTVLHIKDGLDINGGVTFNAPATVTRNGNTHSQPKSLLLLSYSNKEVIIDNDTTVHGYVYANGDLVMNNQAQIYGAVNVKSLAMNGKAQINYQKLFYEQSDTVHHYRLDYSSALQQIEAAACKNNDCSQFYSEAITKLDIDDKLEQPSRSLARFSEFIERSSPVDISSALNDNQCVQFAIAGEDQSGANPWPTASPPLQCYMDGVKIADCYVCDKPIPLYGYVYGEALIPKLSSLAENPFTIIDYQGPAGLTVLGESSSHTLSQGSILPELPVSVTLDTPGEVHLLIEAKDGRRYGVDLAFVPKYFRWVNQDNVQATDPEQLAIGADCIDEGAGFVYATKHDSCTVLGKVGDDIALLLQVYGEEDDNGHMQIINDYQASLKNIIKVQELNAKGRPHGEQQDLFSHFNFASEQGQGHDLGYSAEQVSLIKATIERHCAPYGRKKNGECALTTYGHSEIVGRTVPDRLVIHHSESGKIDQHIAYRGKPLVFSAPPRFEVAACTKEQTNEQCALPSYAGEFAEGLLVNATALASEELINLGLTSSPLTLERLELTETDQQPTGHHELTLLLGSNLEAEKEQPVKEVPFEGELTLTVAAHDTMPALQGAVDFADSEDRLRFGYLHMDDVELPFNTEGLMSAKLYYYDSENKASAAEADHFDFARDIYHQQVPVSISALSPTDALIPQHALQDRGIFFSKYSSNASDGLGKQQRRFKVSLPSSQKWLKPYQEGTGLVAPHGSLIIDDRKRGHDRVFNRREALQ